MCDVGSVMPLFEIVSVMFLPAMLEVNATSVLHTLISFPPGSARLPVAVEGIESIIETPGVFNALFEVLVHWIAYFIACASVTVSLLICMAIVLFSCVCMLEMAIQLFWHVPGRVKGEPASKVF